MSFPLPDLIEIFQHRIQVRLCESDYVCRLRISEALSSPLIAITHSHSEATAPAVFQPQQKKWHCWIVDDTFMRTAGAAGDVQRLFPYSIVVAEQKWMRLGFEAAKRGALYVIDRDKPTLSTTLPALVNSVAALGFLLKGQRTDYLPIFALLGEGVVSSPQDWARRAGIGLRYLENICKLHCGLTPREVIPLYYSLNCMAYCGGSGLPGQLPVSSTRWKAYFPTEHHAFLESSISFVRRFLMHTYQHYAFKAAPAAVGASVAA
jgi:hypothetical protein